MRCTVFLQLSDDPPYSLFSGVYVVFVDVIRPCYGLAQVLQLLFDPLRRLLSFSVVIDVWLSGLAQFAGVNVFDHSWRWVCGSIVCVTPFALCDFDIERLIFVVSGSFLAFDGTSVLPYTGVRGTGRCSCPIDEYCVPLAVLVNGQSMLLNTKNAIWFSCPWRQPVLCRFISRF